MSRVPTSVRVRALSHLCIGQGACLVSRDVVGMSIPAESPFQLSECPRCADLILSGRSGGLLWRIDRYTVPRRAALVLDHYGVPVLRLQRRLTGLWAVAWFPTDPGGPGELLAVPHHCGSPHARGQKPNTANRNNRNEES